MILILKSCLVLFLSSISHSTLKKGLHSKSFARRFATKNSKNKRKKCRNKMDFSTILLDKMDSMSQIKVQVLKEWNPRVTQQMTINHKALFKTTMTMRGKKSLTPILILMAWTTHSKTDLKIWLEIIRRYQIMQFITTVGL